MSFILLDNLLQNFKKFPDKNAFFIGGKYYTYSRFEREIVKIQHSVIKNISQDEKYVGLLTHDDIQTYASIFALWFSGKAFIPLNPMNPCSRNLDIVSQTEINSLISSREIEEEFHNELVDQNIYSGKIENDNAAHIHYKEVSEHDDCYVLFTSGSTGKPKGVPISRNNLGSFVQSFISAGYTLSEKDKFLQIYDLSFDASVHCYTVPIALGACVYTVPQDQIKFLYAYKLMREHELTFVKMPPSTLAYLQPFFTSIRLEKLRYCLLGGEAFASSLAEKWSKCVPNAQIQNVYGPTEATINSHIYNWQLSTNLTKSFNGIVSIGKCFGDNISIIVNEELQAIPDEVKGELCLSGYQVTRGYWKDGEKTEESFFDSLYEGEMRRFYRTGDIAFRDTNGDFMYCGRLDSQVQIHGYRVELGEIEKHVRDYTEKSNVAAIAKVSENEVTQIFLFVENCSERESDILHYLEKKLPSFMLPKRIINLASFPKSVGGKINRAKLEKHLDNETS